MGPLPALMLDYDTGIKKKASPVTTDTEISLLQRLQYDFNGGERGVPTSLLSFRISTPCNILLGT